MAAGEARQTDWKSAELFEAREVLRHDQSACRGPAAAVRASDEEPAGSGSGRRARPLPRVFRAGDGDGDRRDRLSSRGNSRRPRCAGRHQLDCLCHLVPAHADPDFLLSTRTSPRLFGSPARARLLHDRGGHLGPGSAGTCCRACGIPRVCAVGARRGSLVPDHVSFLYRHGGGRAEASSGFRHQRRLAHRRRRHTIDRRAVRAPRCRCGSLVRGSVSLPDPVSGRRNALPIYHHTHLLSIAFLPVLAQAIRPALLDRYGGAAISVLAGSLLLLRANAWPILGAYIPFLKGITLFFWAAATWWIPFLVALMVWRYVVRKDKLRYEPPLWGIVFPLGMYAAATFELIRAERLAFLSPLSRIFMFAALAAWVCTFFGLLWHLITAGLRKKQPVSQT